MLIRLSKPSSETGGGGAAGGGGGAVVKPLTAETVTVACPDHLVLADLPVAKGIGSATAATIVKTVGRRSRRQLGERVHFCVRCDFPIAIYGRLSPCEHAFCLDCARSDSICYLCDERIQKIQTIKMMEGIFICAAPHCLKSFLKSSEFEAHIHDSHADLLQPNAVKDEGNEYEVQSTKQPTASDSTVRAPPRPVISPGSSSQLLDFEDKARRQQPREPLQRPMMSKPPYFGQAQNYLSEPQLNNNHPPGFDRPVQQSHFQQITQGHPQQESSQFADKQQGMVSETPMPEYPPMHSIQPPNFVVPMNSNPLLTPQFGLPPFQTEGAQPFYVAPYEMGQMARPDSAPDGGAEQGSLVDSRIEASFNKLLDRVCKLRQAMIEEVKSVDVNLGTALEAFRHVYKVAEDPQELMLLNWHLANLEYANASLMSNLSMAYWDQDDPYEMGGDHCFIPGGNDTFVRELAKDLPIFYEKTVESIRYGVDGVIVYAGRQGFRGDMVLCTVPLGVLKKGSIEFVPELPQRKKDAIQRLGYGLLNKVALLFPYNFWGGEIDTFGHLTEDPSMRGEFFLFYSYSSVSGGALLIALVAGDAAVKFETMSPVESVKRVLGILRGIFHPKGIVVPDPVQSVCTRWGKDCFTYGSYSYVAVGSSGDDYDILAESVGDGRVFFAGEATNKQYPATMHGAFLSGMREAANILRVANRRSLSVIDKVNNSLEEIDDLNELYDTPNLKFGSFSILFDPRSNDGESLSLLRVKFQGGESDSCFLCLYGLISRKQAVELSELQDDGKRMEMLYNNFQIRLVGRKGLPNAGESLLTYIKEARSKLNVGN